jgi:hypothetical protein
MEELDEPLIEMFAESFSHGITTETMEVGVVINPNESVIVFGRPNTVVKQVSTHVTVAWGPPHGIPLNVDYCLIV